MRLLDGEGYQGPLILMYHSIQNNDSWAWSVSLKNFCKQLDLLQRFGWETVSIQELLLSPRKPRKHVVITFDDGYADNYPAFKELVSRGLCATWFIVTDNIGAERGWLDEGPMLKMLNIDQLSLMVSSGMEIGSHGHAHNRLTALDNRALKDELLGSKEILMSELKILGHIGRHPV